MNLGPVNSAIENAYPDWRANASCHAYPGPDYDYLWFPESKRCMPKEARDICEKCPVKRQCREAILGYEGDKPLSQRSGNFAGMTANDRFKLARKRKENSVKA